MGVHSTVRLAVVASLLALALWTGGAFAADLPFAGPIESGRLEAPPEKEASGLAPSQRIPGLLWTHDDSGGQPVVYAVSDSGKRRGALRVVGTKNEDWEDLASCTLDGKPWLVVGDVGDNDAERRHVLVHVIEEPRAEHLSTKTEIAASPAYTLMIAYEDGPRDCESIAVDTHERALYLLTKRDAVPRLYRVPLAAPADRRPVLARFVGAIPNVPQPTATQRGLKGPLGRRRAQVCAMDFAADRSGAVVLTYGSVLYFPRGDDESWSDALRREPCELGAHGLPQAEAMCFTPDSTRIYVASEAVPKLIRYEQR